MKISYFSILWEFHIQKNSRNSVFVPNTVDIDSRRKIDKNEEKLKQQRSSDQFESRY